jgi:DNA adenine methylase
MRQLSLFDCEDEPEVGWGRRVPHPIPYQGSKRNLARDVLGHIKGPVNRLVEPFAGSAAISLAAAFHHIADSFWINDAHAPLVALWEQILNHPKELSDGYENLWTTQLGREREYYDEVRKRFNETHDPTCFLYLLARCVKAAIRYNSDGEFNNSPDKRRKGAVPETMRQRVTGASALLARHTKLTCLDYTAVLGECTVEDVVYMDPPYQGVCGARDNRYAPKVSHEAFCDELAALNRRRIRYIVSYDGRTGDKVFGPPLPDSLRLTRLEIHAGRSSQATLLGRTDDTFESLYLSESLARAERTPRTNTAKA